MTITNDPKDQNRSVLERFDALLGASDLTALDELCTPDLVNHTLAPGRHAWLQVVKGTVEVAGNVLHATRDLAVAVDHARRLLAPGKTPTSSPASAPPPPTPTTSPLPSSSPPRPMASTW